MRQKRRRLIERLDREPHSYPTVFYGYAGFPSPVNYAAASTPPQGVSNPIHTPYRGWASGYAGRP
jgi:hypothetical protein